MSESEKPTKEKVTVKVETSVKEAPVKEESAKESPPKPSPKLSALIDDLEKMPNLSVGQAKSKLVEILRKIDS